MNENILPVDDEQANLRLLPQWLMPLGYDVECASNGEEAVLNFVFGGAEMQR